MTATVYSQWQVPLAPAGRRPAKASLPAPAVLAGRRHGPGRVVRRGRVAASPATPGRAAAMPVQWADASARGMGFSRARRAAHWRRLALAAGDVCMVLAWAAMIPGLMWLGAVAGY